MEGVSDTLALAQKPPWRVAMVGATGFEPATSSSRTKRATKLRYAPTMGREECGFSGSGQGEMRRFAVGIPDYGDEKGEGLGSALQGSKGK